jgi:membrane fusion protein
LTNDEQQPAPSFGEPSGVHFAERPRDQKFLRRWRRTEPDDRRLTLAERRQGAPDGISRVRGVLSINSLMSNAQPSSKTLVGFSPHGHLPAPDRRRPDAATPRFREQALAAHERGEGLATCLDVAPPSTWAVFLVLAGLVVSAFLFCLLGRVEVTARGRGALRSSGGVLAIQTEVAGVVEEVRVRSGESVSAGEVLVTIDAASIKAALVEAQQRLAFAREKAGAARERRQAGYRERERLLEERATLATQRIARQEETTARRERERQDYAQLEAGGFVGRHQKDDADEGVSEARRNLLALQQELAQARSERTALQAARETEELALAQELDEARAKLEATRLLLRQTTIVAPRDGVIEAVLVRPGQLLSAGSSVGKLLPPGPPTAAIALVEERHRAFLRVGAPVRLEVDQLPVGEFGALQGRVTRVADDVASPEEVREALGASGEPAAGPQVLVEIALASPPPRQPGLRAGMLVSARYSLRSRRIITLALDPLKRWLQ